MIGAIISGLASAYGAYQNKKNAKDVLNNINVLDYDDALKQANDYYGSTYDSQKASALSSFKNNAIKRGVYGQMPTDVWLGKVGASYDTSKASALSSLAQKLVSGSQGRYDAAQTNYNNAQNGYYSTLASGLGSALSSLSNYSLKWPWSGSGDSGVTTSSASSMPSNSMVAEMMKKWNTSPLTY